MAEGGPSANQIAEQVLIKTALNEMRALSPQKYQEYRLKKEKDVIRSFLTAIFFFPFVFGFFHWFMTPPFGDRNYGFQILFSVVWSVVLSYWLFDRFGYARQFVHEYIESQTRQKKQVTDMVKSAHKKISEIEARGLGDTIIAHAGATVVNRSIVVNSFNALKDSEPELADALKVLAGFVENSKNSEAAEALGNLTEAIGKSDRKPSQVRAYWNELVRILPGVTALAAAVTAVTKLFS